MEEIRKLYRKAKRKRKDQLFSDLDHLYNVVQANKMMHGSNDDLDFADADFEAYLDLNYNGIASALDDANERHIAKIAADVDKFWDNV